MQQSQLDAANPNTAESTVKTSNVQQPQPDAANPNTAESMVKTSNVQQSQPDAANSNTAESMVKNEHRAGTRGNVSSTACSVATSVIVMLVRT